MAASLSIIAAKDGGGVTIAGGLQALDLSGAGTGPWSMANILVDGVSGSNRAAVTAANALKVDGGIASGTYTDRSGTITLGGTSQQIMAINANRKRFVIQNPTTATESLYINFTAAATQGQPSIELTPGGAYDSSAGPVTTEVINIVAATTSHPFTAKEM